MEGVGTVDLFEDGRKIIVVPYVLRCCVENITPIGASNLTSWEHGPFFVTL